MITIQNKKDCCGCGACKNICPKKCISMESDHEGFLYPVVNENECVNCGLCEKACPVMQVKEDTKKKQTAFVIQHKDETVRKESTAGGAFTAIASWVIEQGGVAFGASYDQDFMVEHSCAESVEDLSKFRNHIHSETTDRMMIPTTTKKIKKYCFALSFSFKKILDRSSDTTQTDEITGAATAPLPLMAKT